MENKDLHLRLSSLNNETVDSTVKGTRGSKIMNRKRVVEYFVMITCLISLVSCGPKAEAEYRVEFDSNGGTQVVSIVTDGKSTLSFPEDPTKEGYLFMGWYWDDEFFLNPFAENSLTRKPITDHLTVYAKWEGIIDRTYQDLMDHTALSPISIDFWHGYKSGQITMIESVVNEFEELYPMIDVVIKPYGDFASLKGSVIMEINAGKTPNVIAGYPDQFPQYVAAGLVPLESYMDHVDESIGIDIADFPQAYMVENRQYESEITYGIPFTKSTEVLLYNKTFFDAHHLEVPQTWDQVRNVSLEILSIVTDIVAQTPDGNGRKIDAVSDLDFTEVSLQSFYPFTYDLQDNLLITAIRQWGGSYSENGEDYLHGTLQFDNSITREALGFFQTMYRDHLFAPPVQWSEVYGVNSFGAYNTLMSISPSELAYHYASEEQPFELGYAPIPYQSADHAVVLQRGTNLAVLNMDSELERLASWLLVRYLTGEGNVDFALDANYLPVRQSGIASEEYQSFLAKNTGTSSELSKAAIATVATSYLTEGHSIQWEVYSDPAFWGSDDIRKAIEGIIPAITFHGESIDDQIEEVLGHFPHNIE